MRNRIQRIIFLVIIAAYGLASCSQEGNSQANWYSRNPLYSYSGTEGNLWTRMRPNLHMYTYASRSEVHRQIRWYQQHKAYFNHVIIESAPYIYYIYQQTQKRRLPAELALIPVIESDYNPYARSRVGALGLWQMMPATARGFGLKRDWWYDGRKDVVTSTNAALEYFSYLHSFFNNNWLLAIAAYDCGEGAVMQTIHYNEIRHRSGSFWDLPLPLETQNYVPRLLAVAAIIKNPGHYGMRLPPINDAPFVTPVNVGKQINLHQAAKLADVSYDTMRALNPGCQHGATDPRGPYSLLVPSDNAETFKVRLADLSHNEHLAWQKHIVQSRETLEKIAERYKTNIALLRQINGLKTNILHPNQTLLIPPTDTNDTNNIPNTTTVAQNQITEPAAPSPQTTYHVRKGDTLWKIAEKFHTSPTELMAWNNLPMHRELKAGEKLIISNPENTDAQPQLANNENTTTIPAANINYRVVAGDDLNKLSSRFKTTSMKIRETNHLHSNNLRIGQIVVIPGKAQLAESDANVSVKDADTSNTANITAQQQTTSQVASAITKATEVTAQASANKEASHQVIYTVRSGDFIEKIAKRNHVSAKDLKRWNQLTEDEILRPGQKLVINPEA